MALKQNYESQVVPGRNFSGAKKTFNEEGFLGEGKKIKRPEDIPSYKGAKWMEAQAQTGINRDREAKKKQIIEGRKKEQENIVASTAAWKKMKERAPQYTPAELSLLSRCHYYLEAKKEGDNSWPLPKQDDGSELTLPEMEELAGEYQEYIGVKNNQLEKEVA